MNRPKPPFVASEIEPQRAYSMAEASALLGPSADEIRAMAAAGEFGPSGAWTQKTKGGHVHRWFVAGWAITAYRQRNAARPSSH